MQGAILQVKRFGFLLVLLLAGCTTVTEGTPTRLPLATLPRLITSTPTPEMVRGDALPTFTPVPLPQQTLPPTPTPIPQGKLYSPDEIQSRWVKNAGPATPVGFRPPPMPVPLSLHPDDHYWLARPLPSGSRNYYLEWYPFGTDVLMPELAPYRIHHGLDFPNEPGTPVLAASSGTVIHAGPLPSPRNGVNYYGNTVIIKHDWQWLGQDVYTLYAHTLELFVDVGDYVVQGQLLAGVGSSGEVSGPHLHLEVRVGNNTYGDTRNPALWLAPFEGHGTLAGRFVDRRGRMIPGASVEVRPVDVETAVRLQRTYDLSVRSDDVWRENFVVPDLPAGKYILLVGIGEAMYRRDIEILPGRTNFVVISTEFEFEPTPTPEPTMTPTETETPAPSPELP